MMDTKNIEYTMGKISDIDQIMDLRYREYVLKQGIPKEQEFDENDLTTYFVAKDKDKVIGCIRTRFFTDFVKFERVTVDSDYRKTDVGPNMVKYALEVCARKGFKKSVATCKKEILKWWGNLDYKIIGKAETISHNSLDLIPISCDISKLSKNPVDEDTHFAVLSAPETKLDAAEKKVANSKLPPIISSLLFHKSKQNS